MSLFHFRSVEKKRDFLSFMLFLCIALLSVCICVRAYIINPNTYADVLTGQDYVTSLCDDVQEYAADMCLKYNLPEDVVQDAVVYEDIYAVDSSYVSGALGIVNDSDYNIAGDAKADLSTSVYNAYAKSFADNNVSLTAKQRQYLHEFGDIIADYASKRVQLSFADQLSAFTNVCSKISMLLAIVLAIITVALCVKLYFLGKTRYRSLRRIVIACESAALFDFALVVGVSMVKASKRLVIYPSYLCDAVMNYVNKSVQTVTMSGVVLVAISLVLLGVIWYQKYNR